MDRVLAEQKYHRLQLSLQAFISHCSGGWKSKMGVHGQVLVRILLYPHLVEREKALVSSFSYKGTNPLRGVPFSWTEPNHLPNKLLASACGEPMLRSGPTVGRWNLTWFMKEEKQPSGQGFHRRGNSMAKDSEIRSRCCIGERGNTANVAESQWSAWYGAETSRDQTKQHLASRTWGGSRPSIYKWTTED